MTISKSEFFIPIGLLLRALKPCSDQEIIGRVSGGGGGDADAGAYVADRVLSVVRPALALLGANECNNHR